MTDTVIHPAGKIAGTVTVPGDKSISHRAAIFAALAEGDCLLQHFLPSSDCLATLQALRDLGVQIDAFQKDHVTVHGKGPGSLRSPAHPLDLGNSGTGMRLLAGLIAGQGIEATLTGDDSLRRRPMGRAIEPLVRMGARITAAQTDRAPLVVRGGNLEGISYTMNIASAQVKSAILLAGLQAKGMTRVIEPYGSRDHTERLIRHFGGKITTGENRVEIHGPQRLKARDVVIPGDISSAAFLIAAALLVEGSLITIDNVCLNPTRTGYLDVLEKMGARIRVQMAGDAKKGSCEPVGSLTVGHAALKGVLLDNPRFIPGIIDEIPILAVLAAKARGTTEIRHAQELRVKETDRIAAICENLRAQEVAVEEFPDGMRIHGDSKKFPGGMIKSHQDHRIAMAFAIAGLFAQSPMEISDTEFVDTSFPGFFELLKKVAR